MGEFKPTNYETTNSMWLIDKYYIHYKYIHSFTVG